jgi:hypothetical protein
MGIHVKYALFCHMLTKLLFFIDFLKSSDAEFNKNTSSRGRFVPCGQTDGRTEERTEMIMVIVAFRNFAKAPNSEKSYVLCMHSATFRKEWPFFPYSGNYTVEIKNY